jgi:hypothetical protein
MPHLQVSGNANRTSKILLLAVATALVCAAAYLAFFVVGRAKFEPLLDVDGEPIVGLVNALPRRRAHQVAVGMLALFWVGASLIPKQFLSRLSPREERVLRLHWVEPAAAVLIGIFLAVMIWLWTLPTLPPATWSIFFGEYYGLFALPSPTFYMASVIAALLILGVIITLGIPSTQWLWAAALGYALLLTLPGLVEPIALERIPPGTLQDIEWHFEAVMGGKYALLYGAPTNRFGYSFLFSLLQAIIERHGTFSFLTDIRIVQIGNIAFALSSLWACYAWDPKRPSIAMLTLALLLPWIHNNHQNLFFPNQAGFRFISFPLMIIIMRHFADSSSWSRTVAFGATAALAILWNTETGIAVLLALLVHLASRADSFRFEVWGRMTLQFAGGGGLAVVLVVLVFWAGLGSWPDLMSLTSYIIGRITIGANWNHGWLFQFDALALVIAVFAIWSMLTQALARRSGPLAAKSADRAALTTLIVTWGSYYIVYPHAWNLWSYLLPFGLLYGETLICGLKSSDGLRQLDAVLTAPAIIFVLVVGPACIVANWQAIESLWLGFHIPSNLPAGAARFSGVRLPRADVDALAARLAYLEQAPRDARAFSGNSYLLPKMSGRMDLFPERDGAYATGDVGQYRNIDASVRQAAPGVLLFDDPATLRVGGPHEKYFARLQQKLSDQYRPALTVSGWSIWRRR